MTAPVTAPTTAAHFLDGLQECGIEHLFCNLGTDHVSLIEAMAAFERQGRPQPQVLLCPHENVAVHMAGGFAAVTGRGQGVMVHVDAGTANAAMGLHNLKEAYSERGQPRHRVNAAIYLCAVGFEAWNTLTHWRES